MTHVDIMSVAGRVPNELECVGKIRLVDGRAVADATVEPLIESLVVVMPGKPARVVTPEDGLAYLDALRFTLRGPYTWATDTIDE
jgi:hypothetical protein